jgi:hypothetical protein
MAIHADKEQQNQSSVVSNNNTVQAKAVSHFKDNRAASIIQKKQVDALAAKQFATATIQRKENVTGFPVQLAAVNPVITGGNKATRVKLNLAKGDHVPKGSTPSVDISGWQNLKDLGLTKSTNTNPRKWVRFHALNEHAGGPGDNTGNLTATTAEANHEDSWETLETALKAAVPDEGGATGDTVDFDVTIGYPGAANTYWRKHPGNALVTTDASDYPNDINATLKVGGAAKANSHLQGGDGVYGPEHFKKIPNRKRKTTADGAYSDVATDAFPDAETWGT